MADDDSAALAELQRRLAAALTGTGPGPEGMEPAVLERARRSLVAKRQRAAAHLLPRLLEALGERWPERFAAHAERYTPLGLLYHVDDAWELADALARGDEREIARAARDDLVGLRLRWVRERGAGGAERIRERRWPLVTRQGTTLILRLPGARARVFRLFA